MTAVQRLRQGLRAMFAFAQPVNHALAGDYLSVSQLNLFHRMSRSEQIHAINVLIDVLQQEPITPHDLAVAALLHDVGKCRYPFNLWQKTIGVLLITFVPTWFDTLSRGEPTGFFRRIPVVMVHHPAWGAELAAVCGTSERAIWLIAHHAAALENIQTHPNAPLLARLKAADDQN